MANVDGWQSAFVATTFALGDSVADAVAALGPPDVDAASAMMRGLGHAQRENRARSLAVALGRIAADLELMRLA